MLYQMDYISKTITKHFTWYMVCLLIQRVKITFQNRTSIHSYKITFRKHESYSDVKTFIFISHFLNDLGSK